MSQTKEEQTNSYTLYDFLEILRERIGWCILGAFIACVLVLGFVKLKGKPVPTYQSTAIISTYRFTEEENTTKKTSTTTKKNPLDTLKSEPLLQKVLLSMDETKYSKIPHYLEYDYALAELASRITFKSYLLPNQTKISFKDSDPEFATEFLKTLLSTFTDSLQNEQSEANQAFTRWNERNQKSLIEAKKALTTFKNQHGIIADSETLEQLVGFWNSRIQQVQMLLSQMEVAQTTAPVDQTTKEALHSLQTSVLLYLTDAQSNKANGLDFSETRSTLMAQGLSSSETSSLIASTIEDTLTEFETQVKAMEELVPELKKLEANVAIYQEQAEAVAKAEATQNLSRNEQAASLVIEHVDTEAKEIGSASPISKKRMLVVAFFLAIALGCTLAFLVDERENLVTTVSQLHQIIPASVPLLAWFPATKKKEILTDCVQSCPESAEASEYKTIAQAILDSQAKTILLASTQKGEGKKTTAYNTALLLKQMGKTVAIVDCSANTTNKETISVKQQCEQNPSYLASPEFAQLLDQQKANYDLILIVSPNRTTMADMASLQHLTDKTIFIVRSVVTRRDNLKAAYEAVQDDHMLGIVMTAADPAVPFFTSDISKTPTWPQNHGSLFMHRPMAWYQKLYKKQMRASK